ncbi:MAG: HD domain-containing protein [Rhizobiaceae bacterium]|jgi:phosphonate degradation associated HDIG domain protein|nr:HD domain-containing protein [Rhizobiaceae bacterium]
MREILDCIERMLNENGSDLYGGEAVTQTQHALQCAQLAEAENASPELVAASLLHDIGHLLDPEFRNELQPDEDMVHEDMGEAFLEDWFPEAVTQPVRLHVDAKRYLCATDSGYLAKLSPASVHSLELQGGPMNEAEIAVFEKNRFYMEALRLRIWDDLAKDPDMETRPVAHFMGYVEQSLDVQRGNRN